MHTIKSDYKIIIRYTLHVRQKWPIWTYSSRPAKYCTCTSAIGQNLSKVVIIYLSDVAKSGKKTSTLGPRQTLCVHVT